MMRVGLLCGLVAPLLWAAVIIIAGERNPGFDHIGQYISELGARGSATETLMRYGAFVPTGIMHIGFAAALGASLHRLTDRPRTSLLIAVLVAANGLGRIGAGLFACEPGCAAPQVLAQRLHSLSATLAFLAIIGATLVSAVLFRREMRLRPLSAFSLAAGCAGLMFLALMSASEATRVGTGLYERLASGILSFWILITAARLWWVLDSERAAAAP
jgi:hypothetical membrane protein